MPLHLVSLAAEIKASLDTFNNGIGGNAYLAWDLIRRTTYWVHDPATGTFGPGKFVGFANMDFPTYQHARDGLETGDAFDGHYTQLAIGRVLGPFVSDAALAAALQTWAQSALGPLVFRNVRSRKWRFVRL